MRQLQLMDSCLSWSFQITLNQEHKYMLSFAPDYDNLPLIAKVEVFEYALDNTEGNDLARVWNENSSLQYLFLPLLWKLFNFTK